MNLDLASLLNSAGTGLSLGTIKGPYTTLTGSSLFPLLCSLCWFKSQGDFLLTVEAGALKAMSLQKSQRNCLCVKKSNCQ